MKLPSVGVLRLAAISAALVPAAFPHAQGRGMQAGPRLTVPSGFTIERVAGPPLVERPIVADFDEQGRLYVADSSGSNDKVDQQLATRPHRIVRLEDADGDGRFDKRVVFADRMMLPQGTMWLDGSLYVAAPPSIWKLTDSDADGVADQREEWFAGKTLTGCANDLHGPYLGPDGWIYWTKGAFAEQTYERAGRTPLVTRAAHIFRRRPGDASIESVIAGGMDNPVDVAFTAAGDALLTATFLEHPQHGKRDALIHAVYGGLYGKPHNVIDGHPETGDLMPPVCQLGPAAPAGLTRYESGAFGTAYRDNFFAALFNMQKVTRHVLVPSGATFKSRDSDFVVSDSLDFHPTDVVEDADGSLLVVDTGAWYKLCCPTSQLAKPEVLGAIYRVRRRGGTAPTHDARGRAIPWDTLSVSDLVAHLDDARPAVQRRAIERLASRAAEAIPSLEALLTSSHSVVHRRNAVWTLTRMAADDARRAIRSALVDRDEGVRRAALHAAGLWRDVDSYSHVADALESPSAAIRRSAAEALGRIGDRRAVPRLLAEAAKPLDRIGAHSVTYALIEIADPDQTSGGLHAATLSARRAALVALDQIPGARVPASVVLDLLDSTETSMRDAAWRIAARHPEWSSDLSAYLKHRLASDLDVKERDALVERLSRFGGNAAVQSLLADMAGHAQPVGVRLIALRAMALARVKELPSIWHIPLAQGCAAGGEIARFAVAVARALPASAANSVELGAALLRVARDRARPSDVRLDALAALGSGLTTLDADTFSLLVTSLGEKQPAATRMSAAAIAGKVRPDQAQLRALVDVVRRSGPLELPHLLPAFDHGSDESLGLELLAALQESKGRSNVRADVLRPRLAKYPVAVQQRGEELLASLQAEAGRQAERLDRLLAGMIGGGDVRRGQTLFNSARAACASCHAIGYRGGRVGPDLTAIGQIRSERDLLEAIVFPNASFARGYEPLIVTTTIGETHAGVVRAESADEIVLMVGQGDETRIPRSRVADIQPGRVSLMPTGYADQLTRQELADLLAFLKGTRWGAN